MDSFLSFAGPGFAKYLIPFFWVISRVDLERLCGQGYLNHDRATLDWFAAIIMTPALACVRVVSV